MSAEVTATPPVQATTRKTRILDVVYNASNNELVRACCHALMCSNSWTQTWDALL